MTSEIQKWADVAMFKAEEIDVAKGPEVQLLSCNNDPLGTIAAAAKMYKGESVQSLASITDDERRHYLADVRKNALAAPLEFVNFHFIISGVTRGFTHQMVRQRTATYTQESTRFAVKETVPVGLPPSLAGTESWTDYVAKLREIHDPMDKMARNSFNEFALKNASPQQLWRREWDSTVNEIGIKYNTLINTGMPAEDARGLLPTNLLTRINYNTSLRGLLEHSGLRLCTQAQFEWRLVWTKIKEAIVGYGKTQSYQLAFTGDKHDWEEPRDSAWQFEELATIFKPICYQKGSCQFNADVDRACSIKSRVEGFASLGMPSTTWDTPVVQKDNRGDIVEFIDAIRDEEWMMDPAAARISQ